MSVGQPNQPGINVFVDHLIALRATVQLATAKHGQQRIGLTRIPGQSRGRRHGTGVDFEDLRLYSQGDDVRHIDWNATARLGDTYIKRFREERERLCVLVVDLRSSMAFGTGERLKSVFACELAAAIAWLASARDYRVGAIVTSPLDTQVTRPRTAPTGTLDALGLLARQHGQLVQHHRRDDTDLDDAARLLETALAKGGRAIVITGGSDPGSRYTNVAGQLATNEQILVYHVQDPIECENSLVPPGMYPFRTTSIKEGLFTSGIGANQSLDDRRRAHQQRVKERFGINHTPLMTCTTESAIESQLLPLLDHDFL